jgi:hypothetical protein
MTVVLIGAFFFSVATEAEVQTKSATAEAEEVNCTKVQFSLN